MAKCELCGKTFDRDEAEEKFNAEYGHCAYDYYYSSNDFCYECAVSEYESQEDDDYDGPPPGCRECGGPWPNCMDSCRLYDD